MYAIGELSLVVIGILIALAINNWNEKENSIHQAEIYKNDPTYKTWTLN